MKETGVTKSHNVRTRWRLRPVFRAKILRNMPAVVKLVNELSTNDRNVRRISLSNRSYALNVPLVMRRVVMKYSSRRRNRGVFIFKLAVGTHGKISCPRHNSILERQKNTLKSSFFLNICYIVLRYRFSTRLNLSVSIFLVYFKNIRVWKKT